MLQFTIGILSLLIALSIISLSFLYYIFLFHKIMLSSTAKTSLQQALVAVEHTITPSQTPQTTTGRFETCFAQGLDLSEFASSSTTAAPQSHAAALLKIKQSEALLKQHQQQEEVRMQQVIRERVQAATVPAPDDDSHNGVVKALIGMHRSDHCVLEAKQKKKPTKTIKPKKIRVMKKSYQRKHR